MCFDGASNRFWASIVLSVLLGLSGCLWEGGSNGNDEDIAYWGDTDIPVPGKQSIAWPAALVEIDGASKPALAMTASGKVVMAYVKDGKLWMGEVGEGHVQNGDPVLLGSASSRHNPRIASEPSGERVFVAWVRSGDDGLMGAWWKSKALEAEPAVLVDRLTSKYQEWEPARELSITWTSQWPVVFALGAAPDVWLEGTGQVQTASSSWYAFLPPGPGKVPLKAPKETEQLFFLDRSVWLGYGEAPRLVDLEVAPESSTLDYLLAVSNVAADDDEGYGRSAGWVLAWRDRKAIATEGGYFLPGAKGSIPLPDIESNAMWVQIHDDGEGNGLLTWCKSAGKGMVYDIFMAPLSLAKPEEPALATPTLNITNTPGLTDHSEHPVVLPAGRGTLWVAWRESFLGPRVSAYRTSDLMKLGTAAPPSEWHLSDSDPIAAAADCDGALYLAATFLSQSGGLPQVKLWKFKPLD